MGTAEAELRARREGPLFDLAAAGEVAESAAEREARALGAVAGVRRDLVAAERLGAADDELHAFALAPIVGRVGLLRIRCDLGLGERARQPLAQLVDAELQVHAALRRARFQTAERIALAIATVSPKALRRCGTMPSASDREPLSISRIRPGGGSRQLQK